ncbi:MAG: ROK family protein [Specibacter sp.]
MDSLTPAPLPLGPGAPVLAIDVGGTDIKFGLADGSGTFITSESVPTVVGDPDAMVDQIEDIIRSHSGASSGARPAAVGLSIPGIVDPLTGMVIASANLGWSQVPIGAMVKHRVGLPLALGHDVQMAGLAEHQLGAARGANNALVVVIGTGIASCIIINGRMFTGGGFAGEIGHSRVEPLHSSTAMRCSCGAAGCLQTLSSTSGIVSNYAMATGRRLAGARTVMAAAAGGDTAARAVMDAAFDALALALAQSVALLAPEVIVLGGGLAEAGDELLGPVGERLESVLSFHRRPRLVTAGLGMAAGRFGAALRARELVPA